ncbi:MAG: phenylalanine--tRNA ligase subunit alpha [candidate division Zixibacteria bacterium 4484_95]|nr:MAG: phenylalanine--tRNA ligase subunit alpha [candidate division Zixibacteria bacterium 4484_95]RKX19960.1 MAG: phenylalanine--tRNA ligase subunit alpha [candidate division Zixibacteria bacterium]
MDDILNKIKEFESFALSKLESVNDKKALDAIKIELLSRKGRLSEFYGMVSKVPTEMRPKLGAELNRIKKVIQDKIELTDKAFREVFKKEFFDYTLPVRASFIGHKHPLLQTVDDIITIFHGMGFEVAHGPDVETDYYNFDALNTPEDHPSRDLSDTFYIKKGILLRTHTSPVQIRTMEKKKPPVKIIAPGRCYRSDTPDASHSPVFYQCEGLYVDEGVSFGDLKGTITAFARTMFGKNVKVRFRPHFFPFTEPSVEYDFSCIICGGKGCRVCKYNGWLEISGAGMVDPEVFKTVGYDSEKYTGFAFGMGVDRITMLRYQIDDIRLLYENDVRFIRQF